MAWSDMESPAKGILRYWGGGKALSILLNLIDIII